ncbi:MAG: MmgE/PrpD family protein, partial [Alphaproteobacteria bacterium]|nr:MmgE/PrpD family protein [Alphaproteobacteria bacterium]
MRLGRGPLLHQHHPVGVGGVDGHLDAGAALHPGVLAHEGREHLDHRRPLAGPGLGSHHHQHRHAPLPLDCSRAATVYHRRRLGQAEKTVTSRPATDSAPGATLRLGAWVAGAPRTWSGEAARRAGSAFVDTAACMLAGAGDDAPRAAHAGVARWGAGGATVAGTPHRLAAPWAALVNGTAAHALDYDDVLEISNAHVSAVLVPALLALGEEREADGAACVDAFIVGVEIMARLGEALNMTHYFKGWHTTSTLGAPAAAAACARLLRLDAGTAAHALSLATSLASGAKRQFGTMAKPLHAGLA